MTKDHIDIKGFLVVLILTILWGLNYSAIKLSNTGLSPVFTSLLRSVIASSCGIIYCIIIKQRLFHRGILLFHGVMVGILFGLEFVCIYFGLLYTDTARSVIFVYLSPFIVAAGAHVFLKERLNVIKTAGLILAFLGIYFVFRGKPSTYGRLMFFGDLLQIMAAFLWGATTLYIKKFLADKVHPINTFLYQLVFSIPIMLICALVLEDTWVKDINGSIIASLFYQSVIIAFLSYFIWFKLIYKYPVAKLSAFTFLTPIFGVFFGVFFYKEELTTGLVLGLILVCIGVFCANYKK
ncbi:MAG: EamA/RhaT family transporter [Syntrophus sp. (in: bacteria)]|nr:EamA/RhaT family transporter [Syntrophus sp. (in: bacteria)]